MPYCSKVLDANARIRPNYLRDAIVFVRCYFIGTKENILRIIPSKIVFMQMFELCKHVMLILCKQKDLPGNHMTKPHDQIIFTMNSIKIVFTCVFPIFIVALFVCFFFMRHPLFIS